MEIIPVQTTGINGQTSRAGGIVLTVPYAINRISEIPTVVAREYEGLIWTGDGQIQQHPSATKWIYMAQYQGVLGGDGEAAEPLGGPTQGEWSVEPADERIPLERFSKVQALINEFGGYYEDGKVKFPEKLGVFLPTNTQGLFGKNPSKDYTKLKFGDPNPAFGLDSVFMPGCRVRLTTVRASVPKDLMRRGRRIVKDLPIEALSGVDWGDIDWLSSIPRPEPWGPGIKLTEEWTMSQPGGWGPIAALVEDGSPSR